MHDRFESGGKRSYPVAGILLVALFFTAPAMRPGRVLAPVDLLSDFGLWKPNVFERRAVSNGMLADVVLQFIPWDAEIGRRLTAHEMPYANPWSNGGRPLWANPQTAILCPTTWPRFLFGTTGWALCVFLRLALAGLGMYLLVRAHEGSPSAALVSALLYQTCGATFFWILHPHGNTAALLPWLILAHLRLARASGRGRAAAAFAMTALYTTGGHPETLFVGGAVAFSLLWGERRSLGTSAGRALVRCGVAALSGFLAAGLLWAPFLRILGSPDASLLRARVWTAGSLWASLVSLVAPGAFGSPIAGEIDASRFFPGAGQLFSRGPISVGVLTLVAIMASFRRLEGRWRRAAIIGGAFLAAALIEPRAPSLVRRLPLVGLVNPIYLLAGFAFCATFVAGAAISVALASANRRTTSAALAAAGAVFLAAGLAPFFPPTAPRVASLVERALDAGRRRGVLRSPAVYYESRRAEYLRLVRNTALHRAALPGLILLGGAIAWRKRKRAAFMAFAVAELVVFDVGYLPVARAREPLVVSPLLDSVRRLDPARRWMIAAGAGVFPPNLATAGGIRDARSYDALEGESGIRALEAGGYDPRMLAVRDDLSEKNVEALRGLGVRFLLMRNAPPGAVFRDGDAPPAVGLYDLGDGAVASPLPDNRPPKGFAEGIAISVVGILLGIAQTILGGPEAKKPGSAADRLTTSPAS